MHGEGRYYMDPKGHIVLDKYPGEWEAMPSYIEEPEAAACKWVSIREQNREHFDLPTVFSILIYTHPETGLPARDLRRLLPHGHAHGRRRPRSRRSGSRARFEGARDRRRRPHGRGRARDLQRGLRRGTRCASGAARRRRSTSFAAELRRPLRVPSSRPRPTSSDVVRGADVVVTSRRRAGRSSRTNGSRRDAHRRARRRQGRRPGARPAHPRSARASSSTTSASAGPTARSTCRSSEGLITEDDIAGEIGEVIAGKKPGRTVGRRDHASSTRPGIALQDSATVPLEYERALAAGVGIEKKMIST